MIQTRKRNFLGFTRKKLSATPVILAGVATIGLGVAPVAAHGFNTASGQNVTQRVTVMPSDLDDPTASGADPAAWYFYNDVTDAATATEDAAHYHFVTGPSLPPLGVGSVEFHNDVQTPASDNQRWNIATLKYSGTKLTDVKSLKFNTFEPSWNTGSTNKAVYMNFDVDLDGVGGNDAYQGRLVYVPSTNGTVQQNVWQEWDAIKNGTALWTWSHFAGSWPNHPELTTANITWNQLVAAYPNATMSAGGTTKGQLLFRSGEPYADGFTGYLDDVTVGVKNKTTVFNFDPSVTPTTTDQCDNGGWRRFNDPTFNSEGECASYVKHPNHGGHNGKHHASWNWGWLSNRSYKDNWQGPNWHS